jgi:hypothetical protein
VSLLSDTHRPVPRLAFFCEVCDRGFHIVHGKEREYSVDVISMRDTQIEIAVFGHFSYGSIFVEIENTLSDEGMEFIPTV